MVVRQRQILTVSGTCAILCILLFVSENQPSCRSRWVNQTLQTEDKLKTMKSEILNYCRTNPELQSRRPGFRYACKYFVHAATSTQYMSETFEMEQFEKFKYSATATAVCGSSDVEMVIIAHSAPRNKDKRNAIRKTWKNEIQHRYKETKVAFICGETMIDNINKSLEDEAKENGDLIIVEVLDEYHKLTLKHMLLLRWVRDFCPQARFVMKCDDDIMVNPNVYEIIKDKIINNSSAVGMMFGRALAGHGPMRASTKWGISSAYYPFEGYPSYFMGPAVIIGRDAAAKILELGKVVPFMGIDDVYINGILPQLGNITTVHSGDLVYAHVQRKPLEGSVKFTWLKGGAESIEKEWNETLALEAEARRQEEARNKAKIELKKDDRLQNLSDLERIEMEEKEKIIKGQV